MTGKKLGGSKKVSPKKRARSDYKWAKVLGWEIEGLKGRIEKLEKDVEEIKETVRLIKEKVESMVNGEINANRTKRRL